MRDEQELVDRAAVERLAEVIAAAVKSHYGAGPLGRARVYEVLNALAGVTAFVIAGAQAEAGDALAWHLAALRQQLDETFGVVDRDATILAALREAMPYRATSSLMGPEVTLAFRDEQHAEQLLRNLNRLVMDDVAVTVMFEGIAGLRKTGAAHV